MLRLAIFFALAVSTVARAGLRIELETSGTDGTIGHQQLELDGDKLRIDHSSTETINGQETKNGGTMIFDGANLIRVDASTKTYVVTDPAQVKAQAERLKQLQANLPPATRAKMEKAMQAHANPGTFTKGSGGETVAGFKCENYSESRDGVDQATVCMASWDHGPVKVEDLHALTAFAAAMGTDVSQKMLFMLNPGNWPGFPLSTRTTEGRVLRVKKVTRTSIPNSRFQPPADYSQKALPSATRPGPQ